VAGSDLSKHVAAVIAALRSGENVVDATLDSDRAKTALSAGPLWLRALPALGGPSGDGYGPAPRDPAWLRVAAGSAEVEIVVHAPSPSASKARAVAAQVTATEVIWGTAAAPTTKHIVQGAVKLEPGGDHVVVAAIAQDQAEAMERVASVMRPLAAALGLSLGSSLAESATATPDTATPDTAALEGGAPSAKASDTPRGGRDEAQVQADRQAERHVGCELGRFSFGFEGDLWVLRDLAHPGPRASGWLWTLIALSSGAGAVATLVSLATGPRAGAAWTATAAKAGVAAVFALGAFAFFHVARHALRYKAAGTPIAVFGDDRVVVMPWVRRDGAIDPKPEGRFGAGVRVAEIRKVHVLDRDGIPTVSLDTEHGEIDVAGGLGARALETIRVALEQAAASVGAPQRKTAIMRARERTQRPDDGAPRAAART